MEFGMMKAAALKFLPLLFLLFAAGCITADNNYLRPVDFVKRLEADGVKVTAVNPLNPLPLQATEALELQVANFVAVGSGGSRKQAEIAAARNMCRYLKAGG